MLIQSSWLSGVLFIAAATARVYPPAGLKPRYLATGTGISLPSTSPPPYPTSSATGTSIPTSSNSTSTATPTPTASGPFYLVAANPGATYDGAYAFVGAAEEALVLYLGNDEPDQIAAFSTFSINADGTLMNPRAGIASIYGPGSSGGLIFNGEDFTESQGYIESICEIVDGALLCQTGAATVFSTCPAQSIQGHVVGGNIDVGPTTQPGCSPLNFRVVPI